MAEEFLSISQVAEECKVKTYQIRSLLNRDQTIQRKKVGWGIIVPFDQLEIIRKRFNKPKNN